jgi:hypothetical protein
MAAARVITVAENAALLAFPSRSCYRSNPDLLCADMQRKFGCSYDEVVALNEGRPLSDPTSRVQRFWQQKKLSARRGIGWELTLPQWARIWEQSGKWHLRGRGRGCYCMARKGDVGPYAEGNVFIHLYERNSGEADKRRGDGRGWTITSKSKRRPFVVMFRHQYLGSFATQAEAEAVYAAAVEKAGSEGVRVHRPQSGTAQAISQ